MLDGIDRWSGHLGRRLAVRDWKGSGLEVALYMKEKLCLMAMTVLRVREMAQNMK